MGCEHPGILGWGVIISHVIPAPQKLCLCLEMREEMFSLNWGLCFWSPVGLVYASNASWHHEGVSCVDTRGRTLEGMNSWSMENVYCLCLKMRTVYYATTSDPLQRGVKRLIAPGGGLITWTRKMWANLNIYFELKIHRREISIV